MTDFVVVRDCKTREIVHHEEHDNSRLGPRKAADFLTKRYQELSLNWGDGYEVLTGFGPTLEDFLRIAESDRDGCS
jgi:hypothetical protein